MGTLDCTISPLYQYIRDFSGGTAPSGAGDANWFRPLSDQILTQFSKLMEVYNVPEKEF